MAFGREEIDRQLDRILAFRRFSASPRMCELLTYLVQAELDGEGDRLKGYSIGVDVFNRADDFDPSTDSIVRVQTGRLRQLLSAYYMEDGAHDPIRIDIPKGQYQPVFKTRLVAPDETRPEIEDIAIPAAAGPKAALPPGFAIVAAGAVAIGLVALLSAAWLGLARVPSDNAQRLAEAALENRESISLAVLASHNSSVDVSERYVADGLRDALITTLSRVPSLNVSSLSQTVVDESDPDVRAIRRDFAIEYVLKVNLVREGARFRANIQLVQTENGETIWAEIYDRSGDNVFDVEDEIVIAVASELRPQLLSAAVEAISRRPTSEQTAWELYVQSTWTPGATVNAEAWQRERVSLAERAVELDPTFGPAHSVLADKYAFLANIVPEFDRPEIRQIASQHAMRAVELAAEDADAMFNVANHYWHMGNMDQSQVMAQRVLDLDPSHPMARLLAFAAPYTCRETPSGVLDKLFAYDRELSADNPVRWVTLTWIAQAFLNNGDFANAVKYGRQSSQIYRSTDSTYRLATALVQIGEDDEASALYQSQKEQWPSIDVHRFAEHTIARRCRGEPLMPRLRMIYSEMADVVENKG